MKRKSRIIVEVDLDGEKGEFVFRRPLANEMFEDAAREEVLPAADQLKVSVTEGRLKRTMAKLIEVSGELLNDEDKPITVDDIQGLRVDMPLLTALHLGYWQAVNPKATEAETEKKSSAIESSVDTEPCSETPV